MKADYKEIKRQAFHISCGIIVLVLLNFVHKNTVAAFLFVLSLLGLAISFLSRTRKLPMIDRMLDVFDREEHRESFPGRGAIALAFGFFLALFFFKLQIARAAILIVAIGDSLSHLIGKHFGKVDLPYNRLKKIEGIVAGGVLAKLAALIYIPFIPALAASAITMFVESLPLKIDDNLFLPVVAGIVLSLML